MVLAVTLEVAGFVEVVTKLLAAVLVVVVLIVVSVEEEVVPIFAGNFTSFLLTYLEKSNGRQSDCNPDG